MYIFTDIFQQHTQLRDGLFLISFYSLNRRGPLSPSSINSIYFTVNIKYLKRRLHFAQQCKYLDNEFTKILRDHIQRIK